MAAKSDYHRAGIAGNCGPDCPVLRALECPSDDLDFLREMGQETGLPVCPTLYAWECPDCGAINYDREWDENGCGACGQVYRLGACGPDGQLTARRKT